MSLFSIRSLSAFGDGSVGFSCIFKDQCLFFFRKPEGRVLMKTVILTTNG